MVKTTKKPAKKSEPKAKSGARRTLAHNSWFRQMWPKQWLMVCLALFLLLILGYIGLNKYQIAQEKKQFDAAVTGLDSVYADIVKNVGKPIKFTRNQSCGYSSTEIGKGRLGCGNSYVAYYPASDRDSVRKIAKNIEETIRNNPDVKLSFSSLNKEVYYVNNQYATGNDFKFNNSIVSCSSSYEETDKSESPFPGFKLGMACGGQAKAEYYQLRD